MASRCCSFFSSLAERASCRDRCSAMRAASGPCCRAASATGPTLDKITRPGLPHAPRTVPINLSASTKDGVTASALGGHVPSPGPCASSTSARSRSAQDSVPAPALDTDDGEAVDKAPMRPVDKVPPAPCPAPAAAGAATPCSVGSGLTLRAVPRAAAAASSGGATAAKVAAMVSSGCSPPGPSSSPSATRSARSLSLISVAAAAACCCCWGTDTTTPGPGARGPAAAAAAVEADPAGSETGGCDAGAAPMPVGPSPAWAGTPCPGPRLPAPPGAEAARMAARSCPYLCLQAWGLRHLLWQAATFESALAAAPAPSTSLAVTQA